MQGQRGFPLPCLVLRFPHQGLQMDRQITQFGVLTWSPAHATTATPWLRLMVYSIVSFWFIVQYVRSHFEPLMCLAVLHVVFNMIWHCMTSSLHLHSNTTRLQTIWIHIDIANRYHMRSGYESISGLQMPKRGDMWLRRPPGSLTLVLLCECLVGILCHIVL